MQQKQSLILALIIYVISAATSYGTFSYINGDTRQSVIVPPSGEEEETLLGALLEISPSEPKDQVCPLNGAMFTNSEKDAWSKKRPLAVMIENTPDSRPQSGLANADVVFETIAEGGVTRFMAMFYCDVQKFDTVLAPIRSARTYYVDWASGFNQPLYVHVGGANVPGPTDALGQISDYGWAGQNDLNQFSIGYPTFVRDYNRIPGKEIATEHTMVTSTEKLWAVGEKRGWTNVSPTKTVRGKTTGGEDWQTNFEPWTFEESVGDKGTVNKISYEFWSGYSDYGVSWEYDAAADAYKRSQGGEAHVDMNNDETVTAANVIVLLTTEKGPINEKKHMLYETVGTGKAYLFKHGQVESIAWSKKSRTDELRFVDSKGKDVPLARGTTWISIVDKSTEVSY